MLPGPLADRVVHKRHKSDHKRHLNRKNVCAFCGLLCAFCVLDRFGVEELFQAADDRIPGFVGEADR